MTSGSLVSAGGSAKKTFDCSFFFFFSDTSLLWPTWYVFHKGNTNTLQRHPLERIVFIYFFTSLSPSPSPSPSLSLVRDWGCNLSNLLVQWEHMGTCEMQTCLSLSGPKPSPTGATFTRPKQPREQEIQTTTFKKIPPGIL